MDAEAARAIAMYAYRQERDRFGDPVIEHAARVAGAVPAEACPTAWLHEIFEVGHVEVDELLSAGLTDEELGALVLLTRRPPEPYDAHVLRIAHAADDVGRLARAVKLADLDDHLAHATMPERTPPYAWARRHIALARWRGHELDPAEQLVG